MRVNRSTMSLVLAATFCASSTCGALAEKITYTFFAEGGNITGALGSTQITSGDSFILTFVSDTANVQSFNYTPGDVVGWVNGVGTASITLVNPDSVPIETATFDPSDGIFISVDNVNGGVGFGSNYVSPTDSSFQDFPPLFNPVYPFGVRPCLSMLVPSCGTVGDSILNAGMTATERYNNGMPGTGYNLKSEASYSGPIDFGPDGVGGISCLGFPAQCNDPTGLGGVVLKTSLGNLVLDGIGNGSPFNVTDAGIFTATVPEPSTWAMMLFGFAGLGLIGYRQTRKRQAATA
jgi:hypothetical protein